MEKSSAKATAFAVVGDRYHNSDYIRTALGKTLVREAGISIDFTDEVTLLNAEILQGYRLLIVFRDGMVWPDGYGERTVPPGTEIRQPDEGRRRARPGGSDPPVPEAEARSVPWMTQAQGEAVRTFVADGGAALLYHNVTYIATHEPGFREVLGAATQGHPPVRPYRVRIVNTDHSITRGVRDFLVTDEQHFMAYEKDPAFVLMRSENEDGLTHRECGASCEAGWAYEYGSGRVCYLAPGHTIPALWNPEYVKVQQNAVRWLLREV